MREAQTSGYRLSRFILSFYGILAVYGFLLVLFFVLRAGEGNDPVLLKIGSLQLRWYGLIITVGVVLAALVAQFLAERRGDNPDTIWVLLIITLVSGLIVARLWYVAFTWDNFKDNPFSIGNPLKAGALEVWRGGVAIQGGILGGVIGVWVYCRIAKLNFWRFADYGSIGLAAGLAIGRWGNFFNNEAYGRETKYFFGIKIPCDYRTTGLTPGTVDLRCPPANPSGLSSNALFHPTFLYESLWVYAIFLALFIIAMKPKTFERRFKVRPRNGDLLLLFMVAYSIGRFLIEGLRTDSLYFGGEPSGLRVAQVVSVILILGGGFWLFYRHRQPTPDTEALSMRVAARVTPTEMKEPLNKENESQAEKETAESNEQE
jgi:phosphatidylglycerol:prolipoprotein diacylglycerol transferase